MNISSLNVQRRAIFTWLAICCAMIFIMCLIGAITRLTESGLSITKWEPVRGAIPPLDDASWGRAFGLYKQSPQYSAINQGMDLASFKGIYFWEWLHRLWGRLIGLVYALPLVFFWAKGMVPQGFKKPLLASLLLGGLQGFIGWFMVQSGLQEDMANVSAYRLALHLDAALLIYGFLLWQMLRLKNIAPCTDARQVRPHAVLALLCVCITITWGALTAGLDAGKIYNSFPLMNGYVLPPDALALHPVSLNFFENPAAVQFMHRCLAVFTFIVLMSLAMRLHKRGAEKTATALGVLVTLQIMLGIGTLLSGVDIALAVAHQANAVLVLSLAIMALYRATPSIPDRT